MIFRLSDENYFPPPFLAEDSGVIAIGGDLSPERLILAYSMGIFPWPHEELPLLWFSPDPRMIMFADEFKPSRSLRQVLRRGEFEFRLDTAFRQVIEGCADSPRSDQPGTWIDSEMIEAYTELHKLGVAHSGEAWRDGELVGGLYGISLGGSFVGESMFSLQSNASKAAFAVLTRQLVAWNIRLVDAQLYTNHLASLGAYEVPRREYLKLLGEAMLQPTRRGPWSLEIDPTDF